MVRTPSATRDERLQDRIIATGPSSNGFEAAQTQGSGGSQAEASRFGLRSERTRSLYCPLPGSLGARRAAGRASPSAGRCKQQGRCVGCTFAVRARTGAEPEQPRNLERYGNCTGRPGTGCGCRAGLHPSHRAQPGLRGRAQQLRMRPVSARALRGSHAVSRPCDRAFPRQRRIRRQPRQGVHPAPPIRRRARLLRRCDQHRPQVRGRNSQPCKDFGRAEMLFGGSRLLRPGHRSWR